MTILISTCICLTVIIAYAAICCIQRANKTYKIVLDDLNKKIELSISANSPERSLLAASLQEARWMIVTIKECHKIAQIDLIKIISSLRETGIEELVLEEVTQPISHLWIVPIKSIRSICFKNSSISHELLNELARIPQLELLKIKGCSTQWKKTKECAAMNENIKSLVVEKTKERFVRKFLQSTRFKHVRDLYLSGTGLASFNTLLYISGADIRKLKISNERIKEGDSAVFKCFKNLESLSLHQIDFDSAEAQESRDSAVFTFEKLWQFKADSSVYKKVFHKGNFKTKEKNLQITINHSTNKGGYAVEYVPISKKVLGVFSSKSVTNALQVKVSEHIKKKEKVSHTIDEPAEEKNQKNSIIFLEDAEIKHLTVSIEMRDGNKTEGLRVLESILKESEAYKLEKISVYFKYSCKIDKNYIESLINKEKHRFVKEVLFSNIVIYDVSHPQESSNEAVTVHLKHASSEESSELWHVFEKKESSLDSLTISEEYSTAAQSTVFSK
ncbi:hypothetical protein NEMIN01_0469 [Nematocida minor]|uniref:uncharacterized protein n=1 Tax=Nematocida minor TaxID=1912983 RepID=UPI00222022AA|nr:uncharacterized protein NEMIN01_0469 [Nematocida minor]KAI5189406.1 hypothetical protein NEMIN01_0469 [Nematocida minor]